MFFVELEVWKIFNYKPGICDVFDVLFYIFFVYFILLETVVKYFWVQKRRKKILVDSFGVKGFKDIWEVFKFFIGDFVGSR